jgi:hypothetical protein
MSVNHLARYCSLQQAVQLTPEPRGKQVLKKDKLQEIIEKKPPNKVVREYIKNIVAMNED